MRWALGDGQDGPSRGVHTRNYRLQSGETQRAGVAVGLSGSRHISKTGSTRAESCVTHRSWRREPFSPEGHLCQRPGREKEDRPRGLWGASARAQGPPTGRRETAQRPDLKGPPVPADTGLHSGSRHFRKAVLWFSNRGSHTLVTRPCQTQQSGDTMLLVWDHALRKTLLWNRGQHPKPGLWPALFFCIRFYWDRPTFYILSTVTSQHTQVAAKETIWPAKPTAFLPPGPSGKVC